jgi:hypothetical protein
MLFNFMLPKRVATVQLVLISHESVLLYNRKTKSAGEARSVFD